ncbi:MAG: DUF1580 domain-containing protein [Planctomycetota bacterium]
MIDLANDRILSIPDASRYLRKRLREKKRPHTATVYRWTHQGLNGVLLESVQIGSKRYTSVEALQRFTRELSGVS